MIKFTYRHWLIYCAAWIPYTLSYIAVFTVQSRRASRFSEFGIALMNVVPAAICGVLIVKLTEKLDWSFYRRAWFFPAQIIFAAGYSLLWYALILLFLTIELSLRRGALSPAWFSGYALQWQLFSGLMIYATIASVVYVLQIADSLRIEKQRAHEAERLASEANLAALRAQLNPHFLFNTLHSLMALVRYQPQTAETALERLAEMLRYVLREKSIDSKNFNLVSFDAEWRFVENYLALEKLRLGERLTVETAIAENARASLLPAFTLQPLVENAVKHGVAPFSRTATVRLSASVSDGKLELKVCDDGSGTSLKEIENAAGMGLRLVREQLRIHFGAQAEMRFETEAEKGFAVTICLPARTAGNRRELVFAADSFDVETGAARVETQFEEVAADVRPRAYR